MGITMEFYAANPEAFVTLQKQLASPYLREEEEQRLDDQMRGYPHADFSLHLRWPDDIDALCLALVAEGLQVPSSTDDLLEEELWFDGTSAFVGQLSHTFPLALAQASDESIKHIAERWVSSFLPEKSDLAYQASAYQNCVGALFNLRGIARTALESREPLLLFLLW
jgi:hypothetical protein